LRRTERIQIKLKKIQAQPRNLGNNSPPSRNPNGSYKKLKVFDREKLPAIKQAGHKTGSLNSTRERKSSRHTPGYLKGKLTF
jgi:hypothetical protein